MRRWTSRRRVSGFSGFRGAALVVSHVALAECILAYYVGMSAVIRKVLHVTEENAAAGVRQKMEVQRI